MAGATMVSHAARGLVALGLLHGAGLFGYVAIQLARELL